MNPHSSTAEITMERAAMGETVNIRDLRISGSTAVSSGSSRQYPECVSKSSVLPRVVNPLEDNSGAIKYNTMSWWHVGLLMIAETMSLGILSLPSAIAALGLFPGLMLLIGLGLLATYSGYVIGQFKLAHPNVLSMADAGEIVFGTVGREVLAWASVLSFVFIMSAHVLAFSVMMNVLTGHATCTIIFAFAGFFVSLVLTLPRTLKDVSYISFVSCLSIVSSVMIVMISLGATKRGGEDIEAYITRGSPSTTFLAVLNMVLAYSGNVAFFGFISELRDPNTYPKALYMLQGTAITFYVVVAAVIYYLVGTKVPSPALSSANTLVRKIAYGVAIPTIVVAGVINASVAAKYLYVRVWRDWMKNPLVITEKSFKSFASWSGICTTIWILAFVFAEAIPEFNELLAFISALFMGWFTYGISGFLWLNLNKGRYFKSWKTMALFFVNVGMISTGIVITTYGLYATGKSLSDGTGGKPFSCMDNSPK